MLVWPPRRANGRRMQPLRILDRLQSHTTRGGLRCFFGQHLLPPLVRLFADVDSDDNALDFAVLGSPTPGTAPLSVPEPSTGWLAFSALAVLVTKGRRSARKRSLRPAPPSLARRAERLG